MTESPTGLLLFDKPSGPTSFDCVRMVKRHLGAARAGHCGTLDPAARGLLLILVGSATRRQDSFLGLEKEYWFRAQFGLRSSTGDLEGKISHETTYGHVTKENLEKVLESFVGEIQQTPPLYSALKYKGRPYYYYARKGQEVPRVPRPVSVASLSLLSFDLPNWEVRLRCSRGTYVRSLVEDVAERLGTCAALFELNRERIGPYGRDEALTWDEVRTMDASRLAGALRPAVLETVTLHA